MVEIVWICLVTTIFADQILGMQCIGTLYGLDSLCHPINGYERVYLLGFWQANFFWFTV